MAQRQWLDEGLRRQRSAKTRQDLVQHCPRGSRNRAVNHLPGDRTAGILAKTRHAVSTKIGDPDIYQTPRYAKSGGDLDARPPVDYDALDDLSSLSNADCAVA
jgi:hypothetical protein